MERDGITTGDVSPDPESRVKSRVKLSRKPIYIQGFNRHFVVKKGATLSA